MSNPTEENYRLKTVALQNRAYLTNYLRYGTKICDLLTELDNNFWGNRAAFLSQHLSHYFSEYVNDNNVVKSHGHINQEHLVIVRGWTSKSGFKVAFEYLDLKIVEGEGRAPEEEAWEVFLERVERFAGESLVRLVIAEGSALIS